jgi:hypothetical protein
MQKARALDLGDAEEDVDQRGASDGDLRDSA